MYKNVASYDLSFLAKEKGFNLETYSRWGYSPYDDKLYLHEHNSGYEENSVCKHNWNSQELPAPYPNKALKGQCSAPRLDTLQSWLREKHGIVVLIDIDPSMKYPYYYKIWQLIEGYEPILLLESGLTDQTYDQVLERGLTEALNQFKN